MSSEPKNLKEAFNSALSSLNSLHSLRGIRADSEEFQQKVSEVIKKFLDCQSLVSRLALFSTNESYDDINTQDIKYLAIPYYLASVSEKSQNKNLTRLQIVQLSLTFYFDYFRLLYNYDILNKINKDSGNDGQIVSKRLMEVIGSYHSNNNTNSSTISTSDNEKVAKDLLDKLKNVYFSGAVPQTLKREEKIQRFKYEKKLNETIQEYEKRMDSSTNQPDDDSLRALEFAKLYNFLVKALDSIDTIYMEIDMLSRFPQPPPNQSLPISSPETDYTTKTEHDRAAAIAKLTDKSTPLLTKGGKVNRPFTIVSNNKTRQQILSKVQGTGQYLPTMTVDEYIDEEIKRGGIIQGGGESSKKDEDESKAEEEDDTAKGYMNADLKTMKDREWDEFVEENPKGSGNTINRG